MSLDPWYQLWRGGCFSSPSCLAAHPHNKLCVLLSALALAESLQLLIPRILPRFGPKIKTLWAFLTTVAIQGALMVSALLQSFWPALWLRSFTICHAVELWRRRKRSSCLAYHPLEFLSRVVKIHETSVEARGHHADSDPWTPGSG